MWRGRCCYSTERVPCRRLLKRPKKPRRQVVCVPRARNGCDEEGNARKGFGTIENISFRLLNHPPFPPLQQNHRTGGAPHCAALEVAAAALLWLPGGLGVVAERGLGCSECSAYLFGAERMNREERQDRTGEGIDEGVYVKCKALGRQNTLLRSQPWCECLYIRVMPTWNTADVYTWL